jgi:uncharacterized protein (TIGR02270 family)
LKAVGTPIRQFNVRLYREHLEEASLLYDQRLAYLHDPEVNWPDLRGWEDRFEAHVDALVLGGDLALETALQQITAGSAGEIHAAMCVLCRHDRRTAVFEALRTLDLTDQEVVRAASQALCRETPTTWRVDLSRALQADSLLTPILAGVFGYRRIPGEDILCSRLKERSAPGQPEAAWALGRVGTTASVPVLSTLLRQEDDRLAECAAIALMRVGDDTPVALALDASHSRRWTRRVLAIGGTSHAAPALLDIVRAGRGDADVVVALGLLGDLAAVAPLLELLEDDELADAAAVALNTITGARLYAKVFVPDTFDPDELFEDEREAYEKDGTLPTRYGQPFGSWQRRASRDTEAWRSWLTQNKHRFSRGVRWRMGKPYGPAALLECLSEETSPYAVRSASYEELAVRYRLDVPFEIELPVSCQLRFLENIRAWVGRRYGACGDGRFYFAGAPQS